MQRDFHSIVNIEADRDNFNIAREVLIAKQAAMKADKGSELLELLGLPSFNLSKVGNPERALFDRRKYVKSLNRILGKTEDDGVHTENRPKKRPTALRRSQKEGRGVPRTSSLIK